MHTQYSVEVLDQKIISKPEQKFCGWPTLLHRRNGELLAVCSGNRKYHVCPFGRVHLLRSQDGGQTWQGPEVLSSGPLDDRDAGIVELADGTVIVTWFSSLAYVRRIGIEGITEEEGREWSLIRDSLTEAEQIRELGCWAVRLPAGSQTWSKKVDTLVGSPHGPLLLEDGRLLYAGKFRAVGMIGDRGSPYAGRIGCSESLDGGQTWRELSEITPMPGHNAADYHELHAVQALDGRIVVQLRNHNASHQFELLQTESFDGGSTWTPMRSTGLWGYPSHLMRLTDGRLLSTYSHRKDPRGNYIVVSDDHGATWSNPILLSSAPEGDFGYPSTVQQANGELLSLWYQHGSLHQIRWKLR